MKTSGISFDEIISSMKETPISEAISIATINFGTNLSFVTAAIALKPELLRSVFDQIETKVFESLDGADDETIKAVTANFNHIREAVFDLNQKTFKSETSED